MAVQAPEKSAGCTARAMPETLTAPRATSAKVNSSPAGWSNSTSLHSRERSTPHLKAAHAYLFHDLPHHAPGLVRDDTGSWSKFRALEGQDHSYEVRYLSRGVGR
jgi:hypothetical protein